MAQPDDQPGHGQQKRQGVVLSSSIGRETKKVRESRESRYRETAGGDWAGLTAAE